MKLPIDINKLKKRQSTIYLKEKVFAIDFDGCLVQHDFPEIKEEIPHAFRVLKRMKDAGAKLLLWTCREPVSYRDFLGEAIQYCRDRGIEFDAVNENIPGACFAPGEPCNCRKPLCDWFIDDRNIENGGFVDWLSIEKILFEGKKPVGVILQ